MSDLTDIKIDIRKRVGDNPSASKVIDFCAQRMLTQSETIERLLAEEEHQLNIETSLREQIKDMQEEIRQLEYDNRDLEDKVADLEAELYDRETDIDQLESSLKEKEEEIQELKAETAEED